MRRALFAALAFGASAIVVPTAHAGSPDIVHGGCFFDTAAQPSTQPGGNVGVIGDLSVTTDASGKPMAATVSCWLDVNGVEAAGTRFSYAGTGGQVGANPIQFFASNTDQIDLCTSVVFADNTTTGAECLVSDGPEIPPQVVWDEFDAVAGLIDAVEGCDASHQECSLLCPRLKLVAGSYGPLTIGPDGDVFVVDPLGLGLNPVYDCPPYGP